MVSKKSRPIKKVKRSKTKKTAHKTKQKVKVENPVMWKFLSLILGLLVIVSIYTNGFKFSTLDNVEVSLNQLLTRDISEEAKNSIKEALSYLAEAKTLIQKSTRYSGEKVKLDFYVMSQCPYGTQVEDAIKPVLDKLGDSVEFSLNFISTDLGDSNFQSLHGESETKGNIVQLCAIKYNPDKYMNMVVCMNKDTRAIPNNWEQCAQDNDLNVDKIKTCYEGDEGKNLLSESVKKSESVNARGSPTMYLNGQLYSGGRDTLSFMRALCENLGEHPECEKLPEPAKVNLIVINDKKCKECQQYSGLTNQLKGLFQGLQVKEYDFEDEEGRNLFDDLSLQYLPVFLFDETVKEGEGYQNVQRYLEQVGEYYSLRVGASFNPLAEICDNNEDDRDNDGLIDCNDDECKDNLICREKLDNNLQLFIMSDCPYGRKAVEALKEVKENFDNLEFEIHYIASEQGDGFNSLHGQYEVDEDIIQLCVLKNNPEQWFDYVYCRSTKGVKGISWKDCAEENNIDITAVQQCFDSEEGADLLREDIKIAQSLKFSASPTWLVNNKYRFSGIDAETVKTNLCKYNKLEECDTKLSGGTNVPSGSCG